MDTKSCTNGFPSAEVSDLSELEMKTYQSIIGAAAESTMLMAEIDAVAADCRRMGRHHGSGNSRLVKGQVAKWPRFDTSPEPNSP